MTSTMTSQKDYSLIRATNKGLGGAGSPLLTHTFPDTSGCNREAGIITLLLVESPTADFTLTFVGEWAWTTFGIALLMAMIEGLETGEVSSGIGTGESEERGASLIEEFCLLGLQGSQPIGDNANALTLGVVSLDFGCEPPIVQLGDFEGDGLINVVHPLQEGGKPGWKGVRDDVGGDLGLSIKLMGVDGLLGISERPLHMRRSRDESDEGDLGRLPIDVVDDKIGDSPLILLVTVGDLRGEVVSGVTLVQLLLKSPYLHCMMLAFLSLALGVLDGVRGALCEGHMELGAEIIAGAVHLSQEGERTFGCMSGQLEFLLEGGGSCGTTEDGKGGARRHLRRRGEFACLQSRSGGVQSGQYWYRERTGWEGWRGLNAGHGRVGGMRRMETLLLDVLLLSCKGWC